MVAGVEDGRALSVRAVLLGAVLGVVFAGAMTYVGAKTSFIDGCGIPSSIIAFGVLAAILRRRPTPHDGNVVQTVASSATYMAITGGLMGPVAALWLAGARPSMPLVVCWGIALGVVGSIMALPLRTLFLERDSLPFPSGTATGEVLLTLFRDARAAQRQLRVLGAAAIACFVFGMARSYLGWFPETSYLPIAFAGVAASGLGAGISWSPLLVGLGFISGPRVMLSLLLGSVIAFLVIAPVLVAQGMGKPDYISLLGWLLWPGAGLMLGGTLTGLVSAVRSVRASLKDHSGLQLTRAHIIGSVIASIAMIAFGALAFGIHPVFPLIGLLLSVLVSVAAARAQGETDNTPAGPIGGVMQLVIGAIAPGGIHAPLATGGVVNGTLMHSTALLSNWKAGQLTETPPRTIFIAQLIGVFVGGVACAAAFLLIENAYGLGTEAIPSPAARSWMATAEVAKVGISAMPAYAPTAAAIAFVVGVVLSLKRFTRYVPSPVTMGMGFIMPLHMVVAMALGGFLYGAAARKFKAQTDDLGLPLASGVIAGEAVAGIVTAILFALGV